LKACVVDASVAVKWYIPEVHHESALELLTLQRRGEVWLHIPDLFLSETANILWKKFRSGELDLRQTGKIASALRAVPKTVHSSEVLQPAALDLACATSRTVYDCLYLTLAASLGCKLVTADQKLYRALRNTRWQSLVCWVGEISKVARDPAREHDPGA
jgi:predicted nucleic acid-binding protein